MSEEPANFWYHWVLSSLSFHVYPCHWNCLNKICECSLEIVLNVDGSDGGIVIWNWLWVEEAWKSISLTNISSLGVLDFKAVAQQDDCPPLESTSWVYRDSFLCNKNIEINGLWSVMSAKRRPNSILWNFFIVKVCASASFSSWLELHSAGVSDLAACIITFSVLSANMCDLKHQLPQLSFDLGYSV